MRPTTYRAGRNGFDGGTLPVLERLGYTVDTSVDPLFNETRKRGMTFAGAPREPYHPDYADVRRPGALEGAGDPDHVRHRAAAAQGAGGRVHEPEAHPLARRLEAPGPARGLAAPVLHLARRDARLRLAPRRARARRASTSSSIRASSCPAAAPTRPTRRASTASWTTCSALLEHLTGTLGAVGRTYAEFARDRGGARRPHERADGDAAPAALPGGERHPARPARTRACARGATRSTCSPSTTGHEREGVATVRRRRALRATRLPQALEAAETWWKAAPLVRRADVVHVHSIDLDEPGGGAARPPPPPPVRADALRHRDLAPRRQGRALPPHEPRGAPRHLLQPGAAATARARWRCRSPSASVVYPPVADEFAPLRAGRARGGARAIRDRRNRPAAAQRQAPAPARRPGDAPRRAWRSSTASGRTRGC